jgi:hypothetical protein
MYGSHWHCLYINSYRQVLMAPPVNPHSMTTWAKRGFWLLSDRLTLLVTSALTLSLAPSSVRATVDLNRRHAMEEKFAALITNNT